MNKLNESTRRLVSSSQAVVSVEVAVKELFENALDGGASRVSVVLKRFGLDKIDITDDGNGMKDMSFLRHGNSTNKISTFSDIEQIKTFGFRGEVLSSICSISNLSIISKCDAESSLGNLWVFDKLGNIVSTSAVACNQGTTVSVVNIFQNLPVRRQMYKSLFVLQRTLKLMTRYIQQLYLSKQNIQIRLINDNNVILNLPQSLTRRESINMVIGAEKGLLLGEICKSNMNDNGEEMKFHLFVPNCVNDKLGLSHSDYKESCNLLVNNRPVEVSSIFKLLKEVYSKFFDDKRNRYPICFVFIDLPLTWIDVNIDPDKRKIKIINMSELLHNLRCHLQSFYDGFHNINTIHSVNGITNLDCESGNGNNVELSGAYLNMKSKEINAIHQEDNFGINTSSDNQSFLDNSFNASVDLDTSTEEHTKIYKKNVNNSDLYGCKEFKAQASNYSMGRNQEINGQPVRNVNLKRPIDIDMDLNHPPSKIIKSKETFQNNKVSKYEDYIEANNEANVKPTFSVELSLTSLTNNVICESKNVIINTLTYIGTWKDFVIAFEERNLSKDNKCGSLSLLIFEKKNLIFTRTFVDQMREIQIPANKMSTPLIIDDKYTHLKIQLDKLPVQVINNSVSGQSFLIVSCPHLIKNGFRIHSIKRDDKFVFEVVNRPSFIEDCNALDEIISITNQSMVGGPIIRTEAIRKWIIISSNEIAKKKICEEICKLSTKKEDDFWTKNLQHLKKCHVLNNIDFPDLILFKYVLK